MPLIVVLAVLAGALLHATWNVLTKSGSDPLIDTTLILLGGTMLGAIAFPLVGPPALASWPFIATSASLELAYFLLLAAAYRRGDMGLAYPLMRGSAPLLVALASGAVLGESLSPAAAGGVAAICAGVLVMALAHHRRGGDRQPVGFALANAVVIAAYTMVDGLGARRSGNPIAYTLAIFLAAAVLLVPWVAATRPHQMMDALRGRWRPSLLGGGCIILSYGLALWAMTRAPIAPVAALRESSILFGLLMSRVALHERLGPARVGGGLLILAGVVILRLA